MRKKVLEQEFIRLNADYKALLDETIQLREKVATADEALEKMRATEENVRSIHENTRRLKHDTAHLQRCTANKTRILPHDPQSPMVRIIDTEN